MKKFKTISIIAIFSILIGFIYITELKENQYIDIKDSNLLWNLYDINIQKIKENMNPIAEANNDFEWYKLKDYKTKDEEYKKLLDEIFIITSRKYVTLEDNNKHYTDSNYIKKYKNSDKITNDDLQKIEFYSIKDSCVQKLKIYKEIDIKAKEENKVKLLNKIDELIEFSEKYYIKEPKSYNDFLYNEVIETEILKELSEFIYNEVTK